MARISVCTACRLVLRQQFRQLLQGQNTHQSRITCIRSSSTSRSLSMTRLLSTAQTPAKPVETKIGDSPQGAQEIPNSATRSIARELLKRASSVTQTYVAYGVCETLVKECARQADYAIPQAQEKDVPVPKTKDGEDLGVGVGWWFEALGLTPTFNTWAQVTFLHMYLLTVRLRCFPPAHAPTWHQHLIDHFFYIAEDRMATTHNIAARSIRNKYLKDLYVQWRGLIAGYDEGLVKGDAILATAVWRNVFKGAEDVDFRGVAEIVSYIRGVLKGLDEMHDESVASGDVVFGNPGTERNGILVRSRMMDAPGQLAGGTAEAGGQAKAS